MLATHLKNEIYRKDKPLYLIDSAIFKKVLENFSNA